MILVAFMGIVFYKSHSSWPPFWPFGSTCVILTTDSPPPRSKDIACLITTGNVFHSFRQKSISVSVLFPCMLIWEIDYK